MLYFYRQMGCRNKYAVAGSLIPKPKVLYKEPIIATIILYFFTFFKGVFEKSFKKTKNF